MSASLRYSITAILLAAAAVASAEEIVIDNADPGFSATADPAVPILMYHGLDYATSSNPAFFPADFAAQMTYLKTNGFQTITLDHLKSWIETGTPALPPKPVILTFDDNYITIHTVAFPELSSRGFFGYNFAHTYYVGVVTSYDHADWNEIREMETANVIFTESHTVMHNDLAAMAQATLDTELVNSKNAIQNQISGKTVRHLAYPYGRYNATVIARTEAAGYQTAVTTSAGPNTRTTPLMELKRYAVNPNTPISTLESYVSVATSPAWTAKQTPGGYYGSNFTQAPAIQRQSKATWTFTPLSAGTYEVYARWPAAANFASNAPYTISHSGGETTVRVNQQADGATWMSLGQFAFSAATLYSVRLSDDANGIIAADAVRIVKTASVEDWERF